MKQFLKVYDIIRESHCFLRIFAGILSVKIFAPQHRL